MKYARIERERRFLVAQVPKDIGVEHVRITDWYIENTRLRIRKVETHEGEVKALKFTQKYVDVTPTFGQTIITNLYLNQSEFDCLRALGGQQIVKRRFKYSAQSQVWAIDVFEGHVDGLILAETEFSDDMSMHGLKCPEFAVAEVTDDPFFTGGRLASVVPEELHRVLERRIHR